MLISRQTNIYLLRLGVGACAVAIIGFWVSFMASIITDLSGTVFRFVIGFGAVIVLLLVGFPPVRKAYWESIQRFREAADDFENRMR